MLDNAERTQMSLERNNRAREARPESILAVVAALNENATQIRQTLAQNEPYNERFASTAVGAEKSQ